MNIKRIGGPFLAILLIVGIGAAIYVSAGRKAGERATREAAAAVAEIKGMVSSEKESYFLDPKVIEVLLTKYSLRVKVEKIGSREIVSRELKGYDFAFPAGLPTAVVLQKKAHAKHIYPIYFSPMAIASWKKLLPTMEKAGLVKKNSDTFYSFDMKRALDMMEKRTRWRDLKDNTVYSTSKSLMINSADVRKSNSAAMYLALASYVANDNNVVDDAEQANKVLPLMTVLFMRQGLQEASVAGPFEDYTTMGLGKAPLVIIYENQFLEYQSKREKPNTDMVLLYPQPTLYTKNLIVPFTEYGHKLGNAMASDPELQKLAAQYGYRTFSPEYFTAFLKEKKLTAPADIDDVVDPPSYEMLERMIQSIEQKFQ